MASGFVSDAPQAVSRRVSEPASLSRTCLERVSDVPQAASRLQTAGEEREGGGKQEEDEEVAHAYYVCRSEERERRAVHFSGAARRA